MLFLVDVCEYIHVCHCKPLPVAGVFSAWVMYPHNNKDVLEMWAYVLRSERQRSRFLKDYGHYVVSYVSFSQELEAEGGKNKNKTQIIGMIKDIWPKSHGLSDRSWKSGKEKHQRLVLDSTFNNSSSVWAICVCDSAGFYVCACVGDIAESRLDLWCWACQSSLEVWKYQLCNSPDCWPHKHKIYSMDS